MSDKRKRSEAHSRLGINWFGVFAVLSLILPLTAFARDKLGEAQIEVRKLTLDLTTKVVPAQAVRLRVNGIESLINSGITQILDENPDLSSRKLEEKLRHVLGVWEPKPEFASAFSYVTQGHSTYIVAYDIAYCEDCQKSFLGVFSNERGRYALRVAVENPLPMQTAAVVLVGPSTGRVIRFLVYGINWGDAHNRLTVIAYEFNGQQLQPLWSRSDLPLGEVKVNGEEIVLTFCTSLVPLRGELLTQRTEIYRVTPKGIELRNASEKH